MASIIILTVAIIPMVSMFDTGLKTAVLGGNYDTARALANKQLETAKNLPYHTDTVGDQEAVDTFPNGTAMEADGDTTSTEQTTGAPTGFKYTVRKFYVNPEAPTVSADPNFKDAMEVRVTVRWEGGSKAYTTTGLVVGG